MIDRRLRRSHMKKPNNDETATALRFARIPLAQRTVERCDFLNQFQKQYLEPDEGMNPSAHAAELTPETYEIYHILRKDGLAQFKWPEKPVSVSDLKEAALHDLERYAMEETSKDAVSAGFSGSSRGEPHQARTTAGGLLGTVHAHRKLRDEEIGKFLRHRQHVAGWSARAKWTARIALAAVLFTFGYIGGKSVFRAKQTAEKVGGEVEQVQKDVGNFGDGIATDSSGVPIPRTKANQQTKGDPHRPR